MMGQCVISKTNQNLWRVFLCTIDGILGFFVYSIFLRNSLTDLCANSQGISHLAAFTWL